MSFFTRFPNIKFNNIDLIDITKRPFIREEIKNDPLSYDEYLIKEGETPEYLALTFYDDPEYNWVIFLMNDIIDPFYDWPLTQEELSEFVNNKYNDPSEIHHYEDDNGLILHPDTLADPSNYEVTNFEYEDFLNEQKRQIKVLKPELITQIEEEIEELF